MRASILRPDVQNLVIKKNGEIITKATIYVNKEEGYGLINSAECNNDLSMEEKDEVYAKLKIAISDFAEEYNKENTNLPLKLVNIGMGINKLESQIREDCKKSLKILRAPTYASYGKNSQIYNGDSDFEQYTIWEK